MMSLVQNVVRSEAELVQDIADGDEHAERVLFRNLQVFERVRAFVGARIKGAPEDLDDIVGEIVTVLVMHLREGRFDPSKGTLPSYVLGIARNKLREYFRRRRRRSGEISLCLLYTSDAADE